jgi:hypothetical protein
VKLYQDSEYLALKEVAPVPVLADWLREHGCPDYAEHLLGGLPIPDLSAFSWQVAFKAAGPPRLYKVQEDLAVSSFPFTPLDVRLVHGEYCRAPGWLFPFTPLDVRITYGLSCRQGGDPPGWLASLVAGELFDGRFFFVRAVTGIHYGGGYSLVSSSWSALIRHGLDNVDRHYLSLTLEP